MKTDIEEDQIREEQALMEFRYACRNIINAQLRYIPDVGTLDVLIQYAKEQKEGKIVYEDHVLSLTMTGAPIHFGREKLTLSIDGDYEGRGNPNTIRMRLMDLRKGKRQIDTLGGCHGCYLAKRW